MFGPAVLFLLLWAVRDVPVAGAGAAERPAAGLSDEIVVTATATEGRLGETASAVTVLDEEDLATSPAVTLDETLRQVPGFTLFRRSGSRTSNPTTHGASLRGIGGSGAGRALVLADGVPLADPFGGWVPWGLVPTAAIERVEVLRGGASDLYGTAALAGVVQLLRRDPAAGGLVVDLSGGGQGTAAGSAWAAASLGRWAGALAAQAFTSDGYVQVASEDRGPVDVPAGGSHGSVELTLERPAGEGAAAPRLSVRAGLFDEERDNGTPLQVNAREVRHGSAGADWRFPAGTLALRAWATEQDFSQTFTAVAGDRESERPVREQSVPAERLGGSARWTGALGRGHTLVAGLEGGRSEGVSHETIFLEDRTLETSAGGAQEEAAVYLEGLFVPTREVSVAASLRHDRWENRPGDPADGAARSETAWSPRLALRWQARPAWGLTATAYRSFRAPTLNELYRGFRVGDVVTDPNPALEAERLTGVEAGAVWTPEGLGPLGAGDLRLRGNLFWMRLDDPVANVTLSTGPDLILRQRRNLGRTRSRGGELEAEARPGPPLAPLGGLPLDRRRGGELPGGPGPGGPGRPPGAGAPGLPPAPPPRRALRPRPPGPLDLRAVRRRPEPLPLGGALPGGRPRRLAPHAVARALRQRREPPGRGGHRGPHPDPHRRLPPPPPPRPALGPGR
jgi:outer membrane receptor protein involved in Fe transport